MSKYILFVDGIMSARYDSEINSEIPKEATEVDDEVFAKTIAEVDGIWTFDGKNIFKTSLPEADPKNKILDQISELESQITPRRLREALLSGDDSFIKEIDSKINNLRLSL